MKQYSSPRSKRALDQSIKPLVTALLLATIITGLVSKWFDPLWLLFAQWSQVTHLVLGVVVTVPLLVYLWRHFETTLGARKPLLLATGVFTVVPILGLIGTGLLSLIYGQTETTAWVDASHSYLSYFLIAAIIIHLALYLPTAKKQSAPIVSKTIYLTSAACLLALLFFATAHQLFGAKNLLLEVSEDYSLIYGDNPYAPSQNTTPDQQFIAEHAIADSGECGACHQDIYSQWTSSIHSQAASDPTYVANINLLETTKGIEATRYCEGCHAPAALLTGALTLGGMHGGNPDSPAHLDGVGCTSCHRITGVEHTKGTASYRFEPATTEFIANTDSSLSRTLTNLLLQTDAGAHKNEMSSATLYTAELCASCHEQFMDAETNNWGYVTMQHTYSNWLESSFSGQSSQDYSEQQIVTCQNCHMPLVQASDPSADTNGMVRSHRFPGANTAIPSLNGDTEQLEVVQRFMQAGRINISLEPIPRSDSPENQSSLSNQLLPEHLEQQPYFLYLNETADMRVSVTNRLVGHNFPTGTTDLNQVWIDFSVRDAENRLIYQSGGLQDDGTVDPNAYFYKSVPVDRSGNEVWRHDLFNMVGDSYSNLIEAGETDIKNYRFSVPSWAKGPLSIDTRVKYRKFNKRYSDWALPNVEGLPITEMAQDQIVVPLYERAPVLSN